MRRRFAGLVLAGLAVSAAAGEGADVNRFIREGGTLKLERREYRLTPKDAKKMFLAPSNNTTGEKNVLFPIVGKKDVTVDGNGATLVLDGDVFPFAVLGSRNVTIRNLTITKPDPVEAVCSVVEAGDDGFLLKFASGTRFTVRDGELVLFVEGREVSTADGLLAIHALDRFCVHFLLSERGDRQVANWDHNTFPATYSPVVAEPRDAVSVFLRYRNADRGIRLNAKVPYAIGRPLGILLHPRKNIAFFFEDADGVTLENVNIQRFGGMGVVAQRSGNLTIRGVRTLPLEGEATSTTADMYQIIACHGKVTIENCEGGYSMDDIINVHGNYMGVKSWNGANLVLRNFRDRGKPSDDDRYGFFPVRVGDELSFLGDADRREYGRAKVRSVVAADDVRQCAERGVAPTMTVALETDAAFPKTLPADALVENLTLYPDVVFRNNRFSHYPHLRFSGRGKYLIEGNRLEHAMAAFLIHDLKDYWYESGPVADMTIRNNTFVDCNAQGGSAFVNIGPCGWNGHGKMGRIVLEGNRYEKVKNRRVNAWGVENLIDRDSPFSFTYGGKEYQGFEGTLDDGLKVAVERREFADFPGAEWYTVWFENVGEKPSKVLENVKAIDATFKGGNAELRGIRGDRDTHYRPYVHDLSGWSTHVGFRTDSGRATHDAFPYFNLVHGDGGTLIALGWAGTWKADFISTGNGVRMIGESCLDFRSQLLPGERMRTAMVVRVPYRGRNDDDAMNLWRRWFLKYVLPKKADGSDLQPFSSSAFGANRPKPFVDGSDSEDHTTWRPILEKLVAEKCVPDFHWFDAGWYTSPRRESVDPKRWNEKHEKEGHWWHTVGTWELDPVKWPGTSFRDYVRACKAAGMPTFVWFEPERVTMVDDLVKNFGYKKEWALPGGWSIANNLGDKECLAWTLGRIVKMMRENEVEMYREDNNSDPGSAWRMYDERIAKAKGVVRRGAAENLSIQGHYALWDGIIADCKRRGGCPFVDSCASGGGRNDLESMRRGFPMMRSDADRTTTGLRLSMTSTFPKWIPFHGSSSKETVSELESPGQPPDEYASRASFLPIYNFFGQYTINPKFDFARLRHNLEEWKSVNRLLLKDFYVLTPWHHERDLSGWTAFAYHDPATGEAVLLAFRQEKCPDATLEVTLPFVKDPAKRVRKITLAKPRQSYFERLR